MEQIGTVEQPPRHLSARSKARKRALDVLFESELRGLPTGGTLAERQEAGDPPVNAFTVDLVNGVAAHAGLIDATLEEYAIGWSLARMPAVDRAVLRIGAYELLVDDAVPDAVAISEAVAMARELSTDDSPTFVNGVLARVLRAKQDGQIPGLDTATEQATEAATDDDGPGTPSVPEPVERTDQVGQVDPVGTADPTRPPQA